MQAVCSTSSVAFKGTTLARKSRNVAARASVKAVCKLQDNKHVARIAAAAVALPALLAASPAMALVDNRLGGEGTGKVLGVSGAEGWAILIIFTGVWAAYYNSQRSLGGGKNDDSGMSL